MIETLVNLDLLGEYLTVAAWGFMAGMCTPWLFRLVGYLADVIKLALIK